MTARMVKQLGAWVVIVILLGACEPHPGALAQHAASTALTTARLRLSLTPTPATILHEEPQAARFHGSISRIDPAIRRLMVGSSWHPGCPVRLDHLRLLSLTYWGFDGRVHLGQLVVNAGVSKDVLWVMRRLFAVRFPIRRIALADAYGADDNRLMRADVTSAFNCRAVTGDPGVWSQHSYGWAIDINPRENPYLLGGTVLPPAGRRYLDRSLHKAGMIHPRDMVVRAFAAVGWRWGGFWRPEDYQHFSLTGR